MIVAQFGVNTPAVLSKPVPVKSVKDSELSLKAPPEIVSPLEDERPAVPKAPAQVEVPVILEPKVEPAAIVRVVPESKVSVPEV